MKTQLAVSIIFSTLITTSSIGKETSLQTLSPTCTNTPLDKNVKTIGEKLEPIKTISIGNISTTTSTKNFYIVGPKNFYFGPDTCTKAFCLHTTSQKNCPKKTIYTSHITINPYFHELGEISKQITLTAFHKDNTPITPTQSVVIEGIIKTDRLKIIDSQNSITNRTSGDVSQNIKIKLINAGTSKAHFEKPDPFGDIPIKISENCSEHEMQPNDSCQIIFHPITHSSVNDIHTWLLKPKDSNNIVLISLELNNNVYTATIAYTINDN